MHIQNTTSSDAVTQALKKNYYQNGNKKGIYTIGFHGKYQAF